MKTVKKIITGNGLKSYTELILSLIHIYYGATAGIIEMLVQSHDGAIDLLPAIPQKWSSGSFNGFNTREDATVDLSWDGGKPTEAKIHSRRTGDISIRTKYASEAKVYDCLLYTSRCV